MNMWKVKSQTIKMTPSFINDNLKDQITFHWKAWYVTWKIFLRVTSVMTLAISLWPKTQVKALQEKWANKVFQDSNTFSQVCESKSQNSQMNSFLPIGILGYPKFLEQGLGSKPCPNWVLFKPLKMFWNVNIQSGVAFTIWRFETQVIMVKSMVGSQIDNLISNN